MKIYFSGSIRGGREQVDWYTFIVKNLTNFGDVLTEFVADKSLSSYGQADLDDKYIYQRDIDLVKASDVIVADVTIPSLGVGYEIAYAERLGKKIYCLYHHIEGTKISAMIAGNPNINTFHYTNEEQISKILKEIFEQK